VAPSRVWCLCPLEIPSTSCSIALGWSPVGLKSDTISKGGIVSPVANRTFVRLRIRNCIRFLWAEEELFHLFSILDRYLCIEHKFYIIESQMMMDEGDTMRTISKSSEVIDEMGKMRDITRFEPAGNIP